MLRIVITSFFVFCCWGYSFAQSTTAPKLTPVPATAKPTPPPTPPLPTLKKLNANLSYGFVINKPTSPTPQEGDVIKLHMLSVVNNRIMYNSAMVNKGKPVEFGFGKPTFAGDIIEAIGYMSPGDSIICIADADAVFTNAKNKKPDFIKKGDKITYYIKLVGIKTKAQLQKEQQAQFEKQMKEQMAKQQKELAKRVAIEDKDLQTYFTKNGLTPIKTPSGLYYLITEKGNGNLPGSDDTVTMNYTGQLLNGKLFDSNTDSSFKHVAPFSFTLGRGMVIKGWDEGVALLPQGSKAKFFIPSYLAYGAAERPNIPANSILIFDVELVNIKPKNK